MISPRLDTAASASAAALAVAVGPVASGGRPRRDGFACFKRVAAVGERNPPSAAVRTMLGTACTLP